MAQPPHLRGFIALVAALTVMPLSACAPTVDVEVGECLEMKTFPKGENITHLPTVDCSTSHTMEVFAVDQIEEDFDPENEIQMAVLADGVCRPAFKQYVGVDIDESELEYSFFYPSPEGHEEHDDRQIICVLIGPEATSSYRDSGR